MVDTIGEVRKSHHTGYHRAMQADGDKALGFAALLRWYAAMGVDEAVEAFSHDWMLRGDLAPGASFSLQGPSEGGRNESVGSTLPGVTGPAEPRLALSGASAGRGEAVLRNHLPESAAMMAREQVSGVESLHALRELLERFEGCGLKATAKNLCFYRGAERARVMIVGEAPGRDEDMAGLPFVGRAGQLLDKMLAAAGIGIDTVHITNIVYWRPPGNRTPSPQEAQVCRPFLERQVALVKPDFIVLLGAAAARAVLETNEGIMKVRGRWRQAVFGGQSVRFLATLHPAFLLRQPLYKRLAWRDFLAVRAELAVAAEQNSGSVQL